MKKIFIFIFLLFCTLYIQGQSIKKTTTEKLQIPPLKNSEIIGVDSKGNLVRKQLPKGSLANPYILDKTKDINTLVQAGFHTDDRKDNFYTYGANYPAYIKVTKPFITSVKVEVQNFNENVKEIRQTITYTPVSAAGEVLNSPKSYVRLGKVINNNATWGEWHVGSDIQADWNDNNITSGSYIKNKPNLSLKADKTYVDTQNSIKLNSGTYTGTASDLKAEIDNKISTESDPTVPTHVKSITTTNIANWNTDNDKQTLSLSGSDLTISGGNSITLPNYEPIFSKNTAFNKNFGYDTGDVARGNHSHSFIKMTSNYRIKEETLPTDIGEAGAISWDFIGDGSVGNSRYRGILTLNSGYNQFGISQLAFPYSTSEIDLYMRYSRYQDNQFSDWVKFWHSGNFDIKGFQIGATSDDEVNTKRVTNLNTLFTTGTFSVAPNSVGMPTDYTGKSGVVTVTRMGASNYVFQEYTSYTGTSVIKFTRRYAAGWSDWRMLISDFVLKTSLESYVKTVNNQSPDAQGNVTVAIPDVSTKADKTYVDNQLNSKLDTTIIETPTFNIKYTKGFNSPDSRGFLCTFNPANLQTFAGFIDPVAYTILSKQANSSKESYLNVSTSSIELSVTGDNVNKKQVLAVYPDRITLGTLIKLIPSTSPTAPQKGMIYFDSTDNKLKCYDGTTWQNLY